MSSFGEYLKKSIERPEMMIRQVEEDVINQDFRDSLFPKDEQTTKYDSPEEKKEDIDEAINKVEEALNQYNALAELQTLGEDVTKGLQVAGQYFEEALHNLEKYNIPKEKIDEYINRRDTIINQNFENHVTEWTEEPNKDIDEAINKVEEALNQYNALAELHALGEDVTKGLQVAGQYFEETLHNLEKYNIPKEEIDEYINRRDAIINQNVEQKNERTF